MVKVSKVDFIDCAMLTCTTMLTNLGLGSTVGRSPLPAARSCQRVFAPEVAGVGRAPSEERGATSSFGRRRRTGEENPPRATSTTARAAIRLALPSTSPIRCRVISDRIRPVCYHTTSDRSGPIRYHMIMMSHRIQSDMTSYDIRSDPICVISNDTG